MNSIWLFKMAWRDSRSSRKKLFLFMAAIIVGIAAQVAITSFRAGLNDSVNNQARELLGADLMVTRNDTLPVEVQHYLDSIAAEQAHSVEFSSMALFPQTGYTRLSQIIALDGDFPFFGKLKTNPADAALTFQAAGTALVEEAVLQQLQLGAGDSVKIGNTMYEIAGALQDVPGQPLAASFAGPRIFIPAANLQQTGLIGVGSRLSFKIHVRYKDGINPKDVQQELDELRKSFNFRYSDVEQRKAEIGTAVDNLADFLNLIGFIALLLGGIGISSSIFVYIRQKLSTVALLRCVGASSGQTQAIFLIQALFMGFLGSVIGAALGSLVQFYLPILVKDFVPVDVTLGFSFSSILIGISTGTAVSVIFALFPLLAVRRITPLYTLRTMEVRITKLLGKRLGLLLSLIIALLVAGYTYAMLQSWSTALYFTLGLAVCLLALTGVSLLITKSAAKIIPLFRNYEWRQGLANLYRPNNQTTTLMLTFGLGVTMISSLYLTQDILLQKLRFENEGEMPNLALFDIQHDQNDGVNDIIRQHGFTIIQNVPIVTMRLEGINGRSTQSILEDSSRTAQRWALTREYRSTYRDSLMASEILTAGQFIGRFDDFSQTVPVTVDAGLMDDLGISLGDTLAWDVQGVPLNSYVAGIRKVEWDTPQPNFFVVFPAGILENAPQFFATTINSPDKGTSFELQRSIVLAYPNVSAIDVGQILETVRMFVDKITFVIQFIGLFSVLTGLIVLAGAASTGRFQRIQEVSLLRTLGATKRKVVKIQIIEFVLLGIMAALSGLLLSLGAGFLISRFYLEISFTPNLLIIAAEMGILVVLVLIIGMLNSRGLYHKTPLEALRTMALANG